MKNNTYHETVMAREVIEFLHIKKQAKYIDATLGTAGHTVEIIKKGGIVLGIEIDSKMLEIARNRLKEACPGFENEECFKLQLGSFHNIDKIATSNGFEKVSGILFDFGVSNLHLTDEKRGFSFRNQDAPLDMRLSPELQGVKGSDLLNLLREDQLTELFYTTLPYLVAKSLAQEIVLARSSKKIETVDDFLKLLTNVKAKEGLHFATLPMLALRIAVNSELANLNEALPKAFNLLESGGRLVLISFHSKEDEIVKAFFKSKKGVGKIITENYIQPSLLEIEKNPRSRSARLRVIEKISD